MSLRLRSIPDIPEDTVLIAKQVFRKGNPIIQMRDVLGTVFTDDQFADLYPLNGQPAYAPWRLALVSVMQFAENLTDRQAADAVRSRIDWKYALSLALTDQGFDFSVLSEFRTRLGHHEASERLLTALLTCLNDKGLLQGKRQQRTDSTHILSAVRDLNRLENVGETLRHALNCLATVAPTWVKGVIPQIWIDRYAKRFENWRFPRTLTEQKKLAEQIGEDGLQLMTWVYNTPDAYAWLRHIPAIETLRRLWVQQYWLDKGRVKQRSTKEMPPVSQAIRSPYDIEARYCSKRSTEWVGYRVHVTETCDPACPRLITHIKTTLSTVQDCEVTTEIQQDLVEDDLKPDQHLVDAGYVDASNLAQIQHDLGIDLVGPTRPDTSWQAQETDGFDLTHFDIRWHQQQVICPAGHVNRAWIEGESQFRTPVIRVHFPEKTCMKCALKVRCTRGVNRSITLQPQREYEVLHRAREREKTEAFKEVYRQRAGIESSHSQLVRVTGLRQSRYIGLAKTHVQCVVAAVAINVIRSLNWLNDVPIGKTRKSPLKALMAS